MSEVKKQPKTVLEVTPDHKSRVEILSQKSGATIKETTQAVMGWALPNFEDGGEFTLTKTEAHVVPSENQSRTEEVSK